MSNAVVTIKGGAIAPQTLLGQGARRIPTGGKIRPGIMVLTKKAEEAPNAKQIYKEGVSKGQSFEQIERALKAAIPQLKSPLVPRNVAWFTVRAQDFANPEVAHQILHAYGEDKGQGRHLYRFPAVFPADHWQSVMPHELAAWSASEKLFWSQYSADGQIRHCMHHAPVPTDNTGRRTIRIFGGRKSILRERNGGVCDPESCQEYQSRQCNLTGRFLFFIPGVRTINALELPTTSFYAMSNAIQRFQAIAHMRGGRISGFLGRDRETFYFTKVLRDVPHIDENGRSVRVPQWIIELEAPIDVTALLRDEGSDEAAIVQANYSGHILEGAREEPAAELAGAPAEESDAVDGEALAEDTNMRPGHPTLDQIMRRVELMGGDIPRFQEYADRRWGAGWKINVHGRARAWVELERHVNDPEGYFDKIESSKGSMARGA